MKEYHKIQTIFKRDPADNYKTLLEGEFSLLEFEYLQNNEWVYTEKLDGTCIRIMILEDGELRFGGKTDRAQIPTHLFAKLQDTFNPIQPLLRETFPEGACLYGEGVGPKIQKGGGNYGDEPQFVLFDIKVGEWWLKREDIEDIAGKLNISIAPIIGSGNIEGMLILAKNGIKSTWGDFPAEGIVARPKVELKARNGERIITKIKSKDFS